MSSAEEKEIALFNFYRAERLAGADALTANERTHEYAKRLDALYDAQLSAVKTAMEHV